MDLTDYLASLPAEERFASAADGMREEIVAGVVCSQDLVSLVVPGETSMRSPTAIISQTDVNYPTAAVRIADGAGTTAFAAAPDTAAGAVGEASAVGTGAATDAGAVGEACAVGTGADTDAGAGVGTGHHAGIDAGTGAGAGVSVGANVTYNAGTATVKMAAFGVEPGLSKVERVVAEIRRRIHAKTQLTASAGIGPNPRLAKICSDRHKPNGQFYLPGDREMVMQFVAELPVREVFGIGKVTQLL